MSSGEAPHSLAGQAPRAAGQPDRAAIVLAAGRGTRMRSDLPKVLHPALGAPILRFALDALDGAGVTPQIVVVGHGRDLVAKAIAGRPGVVLAHQAAQRGTGDAVLAAREAWQEVGSPARIVITSGDAPLVTPETLRALLAAHARAGSVATVLTAVVPDAAAYGRIVRRPDGSLERIVEARDASAAELALREINAGAYVFDAEHLWAALEAGQEEHNRAGHAGEHYLTDAIGWLRARGLPVAAAAAADWREVLGVNTRQELAAAQAVLLERRIADLLDAGVEIPYPDKVVIEVDTEIAPGARILAFSVIARGSRVGPGCEVGPFAHLAGGVVLEAGSAIGNFVEVKRSTLGPGAKAKHLTYIGDATIGAGANVGAGTVFCNYDGRAKHKSVVGDGAFIGSGSLLVAPCEVGAGARTGAGAVVTANRRLPAGETWVGIPARPVRPAARGPETEAGATEQP